ncbi:MAG: dehydrogenase [Candidatus Omnitrophica bacterium]|nr:1-deoxy-D-xylulose-5-phosphate synthase [bacterium]NUN98047.1 dehydrogenase [Candidatus Omnitrophota bacterium]
MPKEHVRPYRNEPGYLTAPPIPVFQFHRPLREVLAEGQMTKAEAKKLLEVMIRIRIFDTTIGELKNEVYKDPSVKYRGATHLCVGQEAAEAPIAVVLRPDDYITSNHRGHGHSISKGTDTKAMMAEMFGREAGCCKGKGGSMHVAEFERNHLGANAVVGGGLSIAGGAGLGVKYAKSGQVVICFIGDGAVHEGVFNETLNFASALKVPVIFVVEDNGAAMTGRLEDTSNIENCAVRAWGYNIPGEVVDGTDALACWDAYRRWTDYARAGNGPVLLVMMVMRYKGHSLSDSCKTYRSDAEESLWMEQDCVRKYEAQILDAGVMTREEIEALRADIQKEIDEAVQFAWKAPEPPLETMLDDVYSKSFDPEYFKLKSYRHYSEATTERKLSIKDAINETLAQAFENDPRVISYGEDVGPYGGAFGVTAGLTEKHGVEKNFDAPLSEGAIVGFGLGASMTQKLIPVVEIMYNDFLAQAEDQIQNQAAKARYMYGGKAKRTFVVRTTIGGGKGYSCQHGQELVSKYSNMPGLYVCVPATPFDAKGLLNTAIYSEDPVIFFEHQLLYGGAVFGANVPEERYTIPFGLASIVREGEDVTVWAYSRMLHVAFNAARRLEREGISVELIDPRTTVPLDVDTIVESVKKTRRLVCVSQGTDTGNVVHTVYSRVQRQLDFRLPFVPVTAPDGVMPMAANLEDAFVPNANRVADGIRGVMEMSATVAA